MWGPEFKPFWDHWAINPWLGGVKNGPFWTKNGQTWQACQRSKVVQKGPKGTKMINQSVFDHLGPFWAHLDTFGPFQTKMNFLSQMDKVGFGGGAPEQRINFCLKWSKIVQRWAQKGRKWSKNTWVGHFGPSSVSEVGVIFQSSSRILAILSHSPLTWSQPE